MPDTSLPPSPPEAATAGDDLLALLERRRSLPPLLLGEPGPGPATLRRMLTIASRVPDHGRLVPWRFILFEGDARAVFGQRIAPVFAHWLDAERAEWCAAEPNRRANAIDAITRIFTRAPLVVVVVDRADPAARIPAWEQSLTVGAVCMNLINAAAGLGFGSIWLSGWLATQPAGWPILGLAGNERVAGVIHIGTAREAPKERERPDIDTITSDWQAA